MGFSLSVCFFFFFFQAEDGIRDGTVTGVQTCALPIWLREVLGNGRPAMRWLRRHLVLFLGILVLVYTFVPIFIVVMMSFNQLPSEQSKIYKWNAFTLDNWLHPCADPSMCSALKTSIEIGLLSTLGATILG